MAFRVVAMSGRSNPCRNLRFAVFLLAIVLATACYQSVPSGPGDPLLGYPFPSSFKRIGSRCTDESAIEYYTWI